MENMNIRRICVNCGARGHEMKTCKSPILSWGIILIKNEDIDVNNIKFLMVMRKHSLGFSEFVRGRYETNKIEGIRYLFNQMLTCELELIKIMTFDELWNELWGVNKGSGDKVREAYEHAEGKYNILKQSKYLESSLNFFITHAIISYTHPEWGFPKGRRKLGETDKACALREFYEETGFGENDINILENKKPITETLIGTDGKMYKHIYFIAEAITDKIPNIDPNNNVQKSEIGEIEYFTCTEALSKIRDYHTDRRDILRRLQTHYIDVIQDKKYNKTIWTCEIDDF